MLHLLLLHSAKAGVYEESHDVNASDATPLPYPVESPLASRAQPPSLPIGYVLGADVGAAARGVATLPREYDGHSDAEAGGNAELALVLWDLQAPINPSPSPKVEAIYPMALELREIKRRYYNRYYNLKASEAIRNRNAKQGESGVVHDPREAG